MRAIVFGMGYYFSRFIIYKEKFIPDLEIVCICDNDRTVENNKFKGIDIISVNQLRRIILECKVDIILVTVDKGHSIAKQLQSMNIWIRIGVLQANSLREFLNGNLPTPKMQLSVQAGLELVFTFVPPQLTRLECDVVDHCNLNCAGCGKLSNIAQKRYLDVECFERDCKRLAQLYENIALIRLLGGEPLLHSKISDFVKIARHSFPKSDIRVVTNGLLLTSDAIDSQLFKTMRDCDAKFDISMYPPTCKMWFSIKELLFKEEIQYICTEPITVFSRTLSQDKGDWIKRFYQCETGCTTLREGKISRCERGRLLKELANWFGVAVDPDVFDTGWYDIHASNIDGWKLNQLLYDNPFLACKYCARYRMPDMQLELLKNEKVRLQWKANVPPQLSDYFYGGNTDLVCKSDIGKY